MSDRVRFLTVNDTAGPANSSGANGFPFPYATGTTGAGTANPVQVTLQDAIRWWWRVKNWTIAATTVISSVSAPISIVNGQSATAVASRELDLLDPTTPHEFVFSTSGGDTAESDWIVSIGSGFILDPVDPTKVWPDFEMTGALLVSRSQGVLFETIPAFLSTVSGNLSVTFDGYSVTLYYDASTLPSGYTISPGAQTYTASDFWPYADATGNPIYDTTTGAVLSGQSPLD